MSTELFDAIDQHDLDRLATQLAGGADPNTYLDEGPRWQPLQAAVAEVAVGCPIEAVVLLLRYGADPNGWDAAHFSNPLLVAITNEVPEATRLLLAAGADPNVSDAEGDSPLHWAVGHDDLDLAAMILRCGATRSIDQSEGFAGMTALGTAAHRLNLGMIELLLAAGADPDAPDTYWATAYEKLPPREAADPVVWDASAALLARASRQSQEP